MVFVKRKAFGRTAVSPLFLLAAVLFPLWSGRKWVLLFGLAAFLHECGHLAALALLGGRMERLSFRLTGAEIGYRAGSLSYGGEVVLALAGPGMNLLCAGMCALLTRRWPDPRLYRFIGCHLTLALFNLLPALPLDGGRVLQALLESRWPLAGETVARKISGMVGLILAFLGLYGLKTGGNPTLFAAGVVILLKSNGKKPLHLPKKLLK